MIRRAVTVLGMGLILVIDAAPAFAGIVPPVRIPEPTTLGIFAAGALGVYVARKFMGRK
jgi:hypothetical protein